MRKPIITLILCFIITFTLPVVSYGANNITEKPDIRIVVNSKASKYTNVPVIANNRTLLPLREVLTNLGVPNDDVHIAWNSLERSVTVIKDSIKVYLKIGDSTAYVNGKEFVLDSPAVIYKDRTYIPARFIAQSLGYKVEWDGEWSSIYICEPDNYDKIKALLDKAFEATQELQSYDYKARYLSETKQSNGEITGVDSNINIKASKKNELFYMRYAKNFPGSGTPNDVFVKYYMKDADFRSLNVGRTWFAEARNEKEYKEQLESSNIAGNIKITGSLYAGLTLSGESSRNELILSGDAIPLLVSYKGNKLENSTLISGAAEIYVNKNTDIITKIVVKAVSSNKKDMSDYSSTVTYEYNNSNEDFDIVLPQNMQME